jgi:hypothetical protein
MMLAMQSENAVLKERVAFLESALRDSQEVGEVESI